jgi:hypothetical protein
MNPGVLAAVMQLAVVVAVTAINRRKAAENRRRTEFLRRLGERRDKDGWQALARYPR